MRYWLAVPAIAVGAGYSVYSTAARYGKNTTAVAPDIRHNDHFRSGEKHSNLQQPDVSPLRDTSGVTIKPAPHLANSIYRRDGDYDAKSARDILTSGDPQKHGEIIQSSFPDGAPGKTFSADKNGFVSAAISAYSSHRHLKIRPEDVWLAILTQLSSYVNAHAEELRGSFVAHEGKKELRIVYSSGTRYTVDCADFATKIGVMIQDNVVDPELRQWIMPAFSTTTEHDVAVASIVMMASMQKYFSYGMDILCGLPSVTLLGEKADYELILARLDKLRSYGKEPTLFANVLTPVLKRFVRSFDEPESEEVVGFWNHILTSWNMGSGPIYYSGWITAFMLWDGDGKVLEGHDPSYLDEEVAPLTLNGVRYARVTQENVPPGFCTVPVNIDDNGIKIEAEMLAGSIGIDCSSSGEVTADGKMGLDSMQSRSGCWLYAKGGIVRRREGR
ncbi:hypothetical protein LTR36_005853 [Oleoguttula mirabilis]|uniref:Uncharacterized protein n=1 Tax=Oleoguttula mirabilis TaxID=1507867 RepID=A0AAV9JDX8_9PEZI|nr:hypothetical protein LTR36_005853 [Oleoguttula mirabilis]